MPFYNIPSGVDAGQINSGTLPDARLSPNVVLVDGTGKVPASKLPSYVDDVLEYSSLAAFPAEGEGGKIYVAVDTGRGYRWSGSVYVEVSASPGSTDSVPEGAANLYHTTARAAAAAPVQSVAGRTGAVTLAVGDVGGLQTALDGKAAVSGLAAIATSGSASDLGAGTVPFARLPVGASSTTVAAGNDARFTDARTPLAHAHSGADITSGIVAAARLGSGTANDTTFLRGDGTWATVSGGGGGGSSSAIENLLHPFLLAGM